MSTETTHASDGVTLTKYYDETEYNLPSIVYRFSSARSDPVSVRVVDEITDEIEPEHIGFRKPDTRDEWTVRDSELVLECTLEPTDTYETVCAIRPEASYDEDALVTDPTLFEVSVSSTEPGPAGESDTTGGEHTTTDRAAPSVAGDGTDLDSMEHIEIGSPGERGAADATADDGSVVDQLAAELRRGGGSAVNREYLEAALGAQGTSNSTDARIRQLQADLSDFRAYANAIEEFLDENGSAGELIDEFEARMDGLERDVASVEAVVDEQADAFGAVRSDIEEIQEQLDTVESDLTSVSARVDGLREELSALDGQMPEGELDERLTEIETEIAELSGFMTDLKDVFGGNEL